MNKLEQLVDKTVRKYGVQEVTSLDNGATLFKSSGIVLRYNTMFSYDVSVHYGGVCLGSVPFHIFHTARTDHEVGGGVPIIEELLKEFE